MLRSHKINQSIEDLDTYMGYLDECSLVFKNGVKNYLDGSSADFQENLTNMTTLRDSSTELRRMIENDFYSLAMLRVDRVDVLYLVLI